MNLHGMTRLPKTDELSVERERRSTSNLVRRLLAAATLTETLFGSC